MLLVFVFCLPLTVGHRLSLNYMMLVVVRDDFRASPRSCQTGPFKENTRSSVVILNSGFFVFSFASLLA